MKILNDIWGFLQNNWEGIVAIIGLLSSIYFAYQNRVHNRLSIRPLLIIYTENLNGGDLCLMIKNIGMGPAMLKRMKCKSKVDGKIYNQLEFHRLLERHFGKTEKDIVKIFSPKSGLQVNSPFCITQFDGYYINPRKKERFIKIINEFDIAVHYSDLYGKEKKPLTFSIENFEKIDLKKFES